MERICLRSAVRTALLPWCLLFLSGTSVVEEEEGRDWIEVGQSRSESLLDMKKVPTRSGQQSRLPSSRAFLSRARVQDTQYSTELMQGHRTFRANDFTWTTFDVLM